MKAKLTRMPLVIKYKHRFVVAMEKLTEMNVWQKMRV